MTIIARRNEPNFYSNSQKVLSIWRKKAEHHRKNALPFIEPLFWSIVALADEINFHKTTVFFTYNNLKFRGKTTKDKIFFEDIKNKKEVVAIKNIDEIPKSMDEIKKYRP